MLYTHPSAIFLSLAKISTISILKTNGPTYKRYAMATVTCYTYLIVCKNFRLRKVCSVIHVCASARLQFVGKKLKWYEQTKICQKRREFHCNNNCKTSTGNPTCMLFEHERGGEREKKMCHYFALVWIDDTSATSRTKNPHHSIQFKYSKSAIVSAVVFLLLLVVQLLFLGKAVRFFHLKRIKLHQIIKWILFTTDFSSALCIFLLKNKKFLVEFFLYMWDVRVNPLHCYRMCIARWRNKIITKNRLEEKSVDIAQKNEQIWIFESKKESCG